MTQQSIVGQFAKSYDEYTALAAQLNAAWGDAGDGKSAKPRAIQLEERIAYGRLLLAEPDRGDKSKGLLKRRMLVLQRELKTARRDSEDVARCYEFQTLEEQHADKLAEVADLYDKAREVLGDDGIRALMAGDRSSARPQPVEEKTQAQAPLFFMGVAG